MHFDDDARATLLRVMTWRRDVRHFLTDSVPEAALETLAEAMALAPSVGNARPWRVMRVEDPALRWAVRTNFEACNAVAAGDYEREQQDAYRALKLAGLDTAPVQLAVFTDLDPAAGHGLGRQTMPETLMQSTAMAIHGLWLAARALNLGVGMVSIIEPAAIHAILGAPASWRLSAYLCIGWPAFVDDTPLLHRTDWQKNAETHWQVR
jgi:5,6-dimethylbenzimidazole synthase